MKERVRELGCVFLSEEERARKEPSYYLKVLNPETRATLEQLYQQGKLKGIRSVCF